MEYTAPGPIEPKVPSKGLATTSLVLGIVSLAGGGITIILPLLAVVFGAIPLNQGKGTQWDGKGMAVAGLVMGIIGLAGWLICCLVWGWAAVMSAVGLGGATAGLGSV
jgi:hypothetical protein